MLKKDRRDHLVTGLLTGTLWPLMVYGILLLLVDLLDQFQLIPKSNFASDFDTRTLSLVALGCNVFFMQYFNKKRWNNAMRGIIFPTMIFALIWFFKFKHLFF